MKKLVSIILAFSIALPSLNFKAMAAQRNTDSKGEISVVLQMQYPEDAAALLDKGLQIELQNQDGSKLKTATFREELSYTESFPLLNGTAKVTANVLDAEGFSLIMGTQSKASYFQVDFSGLPNKQEYKVALRGDGYKTYISNTLRLNDYSRKLVVNTANNTFTIGDVNQDKEVNRVDLEMVDKKLGSSDKVTDLNRDGIVDIVDIMLVNSQLDVTGEASIYETALIVENVSIPLNGVTSDSDPQNIFVSDGSSVKFTADRGKALEIPLVFEEAKTMGQIQISTPQVNGEIEEGHLIMEYANGKKETIPFASERPDGVHAIVRTGSNNVITIDLGKQVAVKKVTIVVTKVEGQDGKPNFAVVDKVEFLKDVVPANPQANASVPGGLTAKAGNETVNLSWKPVNNVTGYLVKYGERSGFYNRELYVELPKAEITTLDNLKTYYFVVHAVNGAWTGPASAEVKAIPQPTSAPLPPDNLKLEGLDRGIQANWSKTKNSKGYNIYYKKATDSKFTKANKELLTSTNSAISGLENDVEYQVYVTAVNDIGESRPSLISTAIPKHIKIDEPEGIPSFGRLQTADILESVKGTDNIDYSQYPNGYKAENVCDGDYATHWTARDYWRNMRFEFTFKEPQEMNYVIYVPRLDGAYRRSLSKYNIDVWFTDDPKEEPTHLVQRGSIKGDMSRTGFGILPFPKTSGIKRIGISTAQWEGSPTTVSLSEVIFYEASNIDEQIGKLFKNDSYTALNDGVTEEKIVELEKAVPNGFYIDETLLLDELALARKLLKNDNSGLGRIIDKVDSRNAIGDIKRINTFQPLGVTVQSGQDIAIYADFPEGETLTVVPTQYFAEAGSWAGTPITLSKGRNVIKMPQMTTIDTQKGGALYLKYSGDKADQIKLQIRGNYTAIPMLELADWDNLSESERRLRISTYVTELEAYVGKLPANAQTVIHNATEISMPNVLLSLPADQVLVGVRANTNSHEQKVDKLYNNTLAWKDLIAVLYKTHGISDPSTEASRQNIRYARMFSNAFMYASGEHIGIGYGSVAGLVQGQPVSMTGNKANRLFGWGIAHEIGHVMDTIGKAEITNNIYSLFGQTYDGNQNILRSRLEDNYSSIFQKTAIGAPGEANDVFIALAMYWQLHLAYDDADDNFFYHYNTKLREGVGDEFTGNDRIAVISSAVAQKNLTEFFTRWGFQLSGSAIAAMENYEEETRAIYYLSDDSRRYRLNKGGAVNGNIQVSASIDGKDTTVKITGLQNAENVQGYEITRNGKRVAFVMEPIFKETISSMNNVAFTYSVRAIDLLGNVIDTAESNEVEIRHNGLVPRDQYEITPQDDGSYIVSFKNKTEIAGVQINGVEVDNIKPNNKKSINKILGISNLPLESSNLTFMTETDKGNKNVLTLTADEALKEQDHVHFFKREGAPDDSIGIYDTQKIVIRGLPEKLSISDISFILYPGDNITLNDMAIGYLESSYDQIPAGSLVVVGTYRGDPIYNTIRVNGKFTVLDGKGQQQTIERAIGGEVYMFAEVPDDNALAEINNGIWIFVPNQQNESELQGNGACVTSLLPSQIKAELYRTDNPDGSGGKRLVSNTMWISTPTKDTMPTISLTGGDVE